MTNIISREIRLASRPNGMPTSANFTLARTELGPLEDHQVLVRNLFMTYHISRKRATGVSAHHRL